ncbi:hypothetical protein ACLF3G_14515 [Falsiroseomonas sp. HC035]|uniref:hypothetical protein n=1 Tax=Falsiroseomonas sp. HC035 TaxID=3390999 RepID=UPI003D319DF1
MPLPRQTCVLDELPAVEVPFLFLLPPILLPPALLAPPPAVQEPMRPDDAADIPTLSRITVDPLPADPAPATGVTPVMGLKAAVAWPEVPIPAPVRAEPTGATTALLPASPGWTPDALLLLSFGRDTPPLPPFQPPPRPDGDLHATAGRDTFRFGAGEAGRTIHDFEPGRDRVELREIRIADVAFETGAWDLRLLFEDGEALGFADLGRTGHDAVAVVFADGVLSVVEMLDLAAARPADAAWPV